MIQQNLLLFHLTYLKVRMNCISVSFLGIVTVICFGDISIAIPLCCVTFCSSVFAAIFSSDCAFAEGGGSSGSLVASVSSSVPDMFAEPAGSGKTIS